jgi:hypothetical protein
MITVVTWRWGKKYGPGHVAKMQSMLSRHLHQPHRLVCITDRPKELPKGVEPAAMPSVLSWDFKGLRRMWLYSAEAARLGDRLFQLDLDVVLTDTIDPIVNRPEPFVIWKSDSNWKDKWAYNATVMLITPGAQEPLWRRYIANPRGIFDEAERDGWGSRVNSDQALACYLLKGQDVPVWTAADGVVAHRVFAGKHGDRPCACAETPGVGCGQHLPAGARIVSFHGPRDPSIPYLQEKSRWIREHWR